MSVQSPILHGLPICLSICLFIVRSFCISISFKPSTSLYIHVPTNCHPVMDQFIFHLSPLSYVSMDTTPILSFIYTAENLFNLSINLMLTHHCPRIQSLCNPIQTEIVFSFIYYRYFHQFLTIQNALTRSTSPLPPLI